MMLTAIISFPEGDVLLDADVLEQLGTRTIYIGNHGYPCFSTEQTGPVLLHLFVMGGAIKGKTVDHRDGNKLDCRRSNLRRVTYQVNQINRKRLNRNNTSGYRGVSLNQGRWTARLKVDGKYIWLGTFSTIEEAVAARSVGEREHLPELCPTTAKAA